MTQNEIDHERSCEASAIQVTTWTEQLWLILPILASKQDAVNLIRVSVKYASETDDWFTACALCGDRLESVAFTPSHTICVSNFLRVISVTIKSVRAQRLYGQWNSISIGALKAGTAGADSKRVCRSAQFRVRESVKHLAKLCNLTCRWHSDEDSI